jgi:two-component system sensor histidine kinase ChiS
MEKPIIICVDDEAIILNALRDQLIRTLSGNYEIETIDDPAEAIEFVKDLTEDGEEVVLVISDQIMPVIRGDQLLKEIHTISPKTLKIMLTGQADAEAVGKAVNEASLYRYIAKPWDKTDLTMTVEEALRVYAKDRELERLNEELSSKVDTFYKFVPMQFLEALDVKEYEKIELDLCADRNMSVMFSDIRSFTTLSEQMTSQQNFSFINSYLSHMGPIIRDRNGFIDKYIGDAIMALFEKAEDAVWASLHMLAHLKEYNAGRLRAGYEAIAIGIGINSGQLTLGTVGESGRLQTTVIGDMVNLASRVESLTKLYSAPLLITEQTLNELNSKEDLVFREIDDVVVKGKTRAVKIYEVLDTQEALLKSAKTALVGLFEEALSCYQAENFDQAKTLFEQCLSLCPEDKASLIYLERLSALQK